MALGSNEEVQRMNRKRPHTWRFYRKRYRGFCRRMVWVIALLFLGIVGGIENGTLPVGLSVLWLFLLCPIELYVYSVGYGLGKRGAVCEKKSV